MTDFWLQHLGRPRAAARLQGSGAYPGLGGTVYFYPMASGLMVAADVYGLPGESSFFAFHIHSGGQCGGSEQAPFADAGGHYDPRGRPHPMHAGDLPPLLSDHGRALQAVWTGRLTLREVLGRTVILHANPDDLHTQPAGGAGPRIACGVIRPLR